MDEKLISALKSKGYDSFEFLDKGTWGKVYKIKRNISKEEEQALKFLDPNKIAKSQMSRRGLNLYKIIVTESLTLEQRSNSHIVPRYLDFVNIDENNNRGYLIMPYYKNGNLKSILENKHYNNGIELNEVHEIIKDMILGVSQLNYSLKISHNDIKFENFVRNSEGKVLINDWGSSTPYKENNNKYYDFEKYKFDNIGEIKTRPPENFKKGNIPNETSDVWSLGSNIFKILTGKYIFENNLKFEKNPVKFMTSLSIEEGNKLIKQQLNYFQKQIPKHLKKNLEICLNFDPEKRHKNTTEVYDKFNRNITKYEKNTPLKKWSKIVIATLMTSFLFLGINNYNIFKSEVELEKERLKNSILEIKRDHKTREELMSIIKNNQYFFLSHSPYSIKESGYKFDATIKIFDWPDFFPKGFDNKEMLSKFIPQKKITGFENIDMSLKNKLNMDFDENCKHQKEIILNLNIFDESSINLIDEIYFNKFKSIKNNYKHLFQMDSLLRDTLSKENEITDKQIYDSIIHFFVRMYQYQDAHTIFMETSNHMNGFIHYMIAPKDTPHKDDYMISMYLETNEGKKSFQDKSFKQKFNEFKENTSTEDLKTYFTNHITDSIKFKHNYISTKFEFIIKELDEWDIKNKAKSSKVYKFNSN
jgi:hypothetical protein